MSYHSADGGAMHNWTTFLGWLSAATAFAIVGCTWAFAIARYGGPDEPAHIIRAAGAAHGDLLGKPVEGFEPGYRQFSVPSPLATGDPACYRHDETITAACAIASVGTDTRQVASSAGSAPPWYYVFVGVPTRLASDGGTVLAYRMTAVVLCAFVLGYALMRSRRYSGGAWLLAALTPSAWFLVGVVGTSAIEIALVALALVEAVGRFGSPAGDASILRVTVPLAICLTLRPAAMIDVVVVGLMLAPTLPRPFTRRCAAELVSPLIAAAAVTVAWNSWAGLVVRDTRTADTSSLATALHRSLKGIPTTAHQAAGALGWNEFFAPVVAQVVWWTTLGFAVYWVAVRSSDQWWRAWRSWHLRWAAIALLLPTVIELIIHRRIGEIWQGRYSIPFAVGGVLYGARSARPGRVVMTALVAAAGLAEIATLWHTLRRFMVGLDGSMTLQGASWRPALNPWLLLAVNAAAIAWLAVMALGSGDDVAEHVDDVVRGAGVVVQRQLSI